jgi:hypothetical protein
VHGDLPFDRQLPVSFGRREEVGLVIVVSSHLSIGPLIVSSSTSTVQQSGVFLNPVDICFKATKLLRVLL